MKITKFGGLGRALLIIYESFNNVRPILISDDIALTVAKMKKSVTFLILRATHFEKWKRPSACYQLRASLYVTLFFRIRGGGEVRGSIR